MTLAQANCIPHRKPRNLIRTLTTWIALARQRRAWPPSPTHNATTSTSAPKRPKKRQKGHFGTCRPIGAAKSDISAHIHTILTPCGLDFSRPSANI